MRTQFDQWEAECRRLLKEAVFLAAYDCALKCSHLFNLLDARGALSVSERQNYILRVRAMTRDCAKAYVKSKEVPSGDR